MSCFRLGDWLTEAETGARPWTFQGAAVSWGQDFAFPLTHEFQRDNFLGHLNNAEGGGVPLLYFWNQRTGLALAHIEPEPKDWYMPVSVDARGRAAAGLELRQMRELLPGEAVSGLATLFSIHQGDFFDPLSLYRDTLADRGLRPAQPDPEDYAPAWCSWGYEFDVLPSEVTGVLPVLKELGINWLTLTIAGSIVMGIGTRASILSRRRSSAAARWLLPCTGQAITLSSGGIHWQWRMELAVGRAMPTGRRIFCMPTRIG